MNLTDFMQSDQSELITVQGIGRMRLDQAKKRVQQMLNDLNDRVDNLVLEPGRDNAEWITVANLMKRRVLQAYLDAIADATSKQH